MDTSNPAPPTRRKTLKLRYRSQWLLAGIIIAVLYLLMATLVIWRHCLWASPQAAAAAYLKALQHRDPVGIYLYSHMLGPRLAGMMAKSNLTEQQRRQLWAKDLVRWQGEFSKGQLANDPVRRERQLINPHTKITPVHPQDYRAEVRLDGDLYLASYPDVPGQTYHFYYRLAYPTAQAAPPVQVLQNVHTAPKRRIKSVVIHLEVQRRPEVQGWPAWLLERDWLRRLEAVVPAGLFSKNKPERVWAVKLNFNVDKLTLETF